LSTLSAVSRSVVRAMSAFLPRSRPHRCIYDGPEDCGERWRMCKARKYTRSAMSTRFLLTIGECGRRATNGPGRGSFLLRLYSQSSDQFFDRRNFRRKARGELFGHPADDLIAGRYACSRASGVFSAARVALDKTAMISGGVPAGANNALNESENKHGEPDPITGGTAR